jgi:hypothetical protein
VGEPIIDINSENIIDVHTHKYVNLLKKECEQLVLTFAILQSCIRAGLVEKDNWGTGTDKIN